MRNKAGRVITPLSGIKETGENVPCLKHFFRCLETSGTQMNDSKGGVVIDMNDTIIVSGSLSFDSTTKTVYPSTTSAQFPLHSGAWEAVPSGYSVLNFAVGDVQEPINLRAPIGGGGSEGFSINTVGTHMIVNGASASINYNTDIAPTSLSRSGSTVTVTKVAHGYADSDVIQLVNQTPSDMRGAYTIHKIDNDSFSYTATGTAGAASVVGTMSTNAVLQNDQIYIYQTYDPGTGNAVLKSYLTDGTTVRVNMSTTNAVGTITPAQTSRPTGMKFYGWAVFYFSGGLPSDLAVALNWMSGEWRRGNRYIWPGWIDLV